MFYKSEQDNVQKSIFFLYEMIYPALEKIRFKITEKEQENKKNKQTNKQTKMHNNVMTSVQPYKY